MRKNGGKKVVLIGDEEATTEREGGKENEKVALKVFGSRNNYLKLLYR